MLARPLGARHHRPSVSLVDIAFPYRRQRRFGMASFALVFLVLIVEIELLVLIALGVIAKRFDLFLAVQPVVLPAAALVSLASAAVFAWRARRWTDERMRSLGEWGTGASGFAERLAQSRKG